MNDAQSAMMLWVSQLRADGHNSALVCWQCKGGFGPRQRIVIVRKDPSQPPTADNLAPAHVPGAIGCVSHAKPHEPRERQEARKRSATVGVVTDRSGLLPW